MALFNERIVRIKEKLVKAREADKELKVFGAGSHRYQLHPPATEEAVASLEQQYGIELPECYKAFILQIGNGGISYDRSAAGPHYGIYPLGERLDLLIRNPEKHLRNDCLLSPYMSQEGWQALNSRLESDDLSDEAYEEERGRVIGGILPIGTQGCTYYHGIILNGEYRGRVVNLEETMDLKPQFTFEKNFLDWYERWLDEIISGELLEDRAQSFGYSMGGTEEELLAGYLANKGSHEQHAYLDGILSKRKLSSNTVMQIEAAYIECQDTGQLALLRILTKFSYLRAKPHLIELIETDIRAAVRLIYSYRRFDGRDWQAIIKDNISRVEDEETLNYCIFLLSDANCDYGHLIAPFAGKNDENIRITALNTLGTLPDKHIYIDIFLTGLQDSSNKVVMVSLRASSGIRDKRLLPLYQTILKRFPDGQDHGYVLSTLDEALQKWGMNRTALLNAEFPDTAGPS